MFKKVVVVIALLPLLAIIGLLITGHGYIFTAVERTYLQGNSTANINDHIAFDTNVINTQSPSPLPQSADYNQGKLSSDTLTVLNKYGTAAYLVIKDGEVIQEHYLNGYHDRSKTNSFSMAKTVLTLLVGVAIEEGIIDSLEQPLTDFLPEFAQDPYGKNATIGQLSLMNSGYDWTEHYYSPFSPTVELMYGSNVEGFLVNRHFSSEPASFFEYSSASTQLLGIVLKRALTKAGKPQTLSQFLSSRIWQPLQMNDDALWHTDSKGMELVYCCINTNARNYAKLGMLMLNMGQWHGQQIIPADYIQSMTTPVATEFYGYSTWINNTFSPNYYWFSGHLGQYIIVIPEHDMVVVRLGETRASDTDFRSVEVPMLINEALRLVDLENH